MIGPDRNGMQPEDPGERIAQRRLSVLQLAEVLGNVCEACRRSGIDRKRFCEKDASQFLVLEEDVDDLECDHLQLLPQV